MLLQPPPAVRAEAHRPTSGVRQEAHDVEHVPVGLGLPAGAVDVRRGEATRDLRAVPQGQVGRPVRDVEPGRGRWRSRPSRRRR